MTDVLFKNLVERGELRAEEVEEAIIQYLELCGYSKLAEQGRQYGMIFEDMGVGLKESTKWLSIQIKKI